LRTPAASHSVTGMRTTPHDGSSTWAVRHRQALLSRAVLALLIATLGVATGCSGQSGFLSRGPTIGQMKTSLSHLEYENVELKKSVAKLQQENRSMEDRLVQEQIDNGDLTARLDDARNLLRNRGIEPDVRLGSRRPSGNGAGSSRDDDDTSGRTVPASRGDRQRRKPPFAQISGQVDAIPSADDDDNAPKQKPRARRNSKSDRSGQGFDDVLDHHSYQPGPSRWNPVARADDDSTIQIR
jgi:hypothetical protein